MRRGNKAVLNLNHRVLRAGSFICSLDACAVRIGGSSPLRRGRGEGVSRSHGSANACMSACMHCCDHAPSAEPPIGTWHPVFGMPCKRLLTRLSYFCCSVDCCRAAISSTRYRAVQSWKRLLQEAVKELVLATDLRELPYVGFTHVDMKLL